ncbi:MAG TPA: glycosyltransferase family 4 protein [Polyangia bacterium]|nr:glycosyltransferase family 4 protein [Polyangia bacterium]
MEQSNSPALQPGDLAMAAAPARKYVTAFAGARDSYQVPLALAETDQLDCLITDLYLPKLPTSLTDRFPKLQRRYVPGLSVRDTRSSASILWKTYVGWRFAQDRNRSLLASLKWSQDALARFAAQRALSRDSDLFLYAGYALKAFENPALSKARRILFMYHPHIALSSEILIRDASQYPESESTRAELLADQQDRDVDRELELADLVVCASEFTASTVRAIGIDGRKLAVIPYGVDVPSAPLQPKSRERCHFLFVGSGIHRKGLHLLCDAWRTMNLPDAHLTVVCRHMESWIRERADVPGLTIRPGVTPDELNRLYDDAHVFVLPSLVEGFGYVYLEALARGCFCIGTKNTGLPDLGLSADESATITPGDVNALSQCLRDTYQRWRAGRIDPQRIQDSVKAWSWARFRASIADHARKLEQRPRIGGGGLSIVSDKSETAVRPLRVAVLQPGARMHYAVPTLLARAGLLCHFYTDAAGNVGWTDAVGKMTPSWARSARMNRLLGRKIPPEIPSDRVTTAQSLVLRDVLLRRMPADRGWSETAVDWLRKKMIEDDFHGANALYCLDNSDLEMIQEAKRRGLAVAYEQVIAPQVGRILREERARFPGPEAQEPEEAVEAGIRRDREVWELADLVLAPSEFVREGIISLGADPARVKLVPYGLPERWYGMPAQPIPGRVLFVGTVGLRKGSHYLAEAFALLRQRGVNADFRVVGRYNPATVATPLFAGPDYVGLVGRDQIQREFAQADVFAFPTIAEGFALVHLEAMAYGVPVVTTPNCGPAVRDGQDGFVIQPRDPVALADRIQSIISDRALRDRLGASAKERATEYSWANYRKRLIAAVEQMRPDPRRG